ncbi:type II toxin-antitoxin system RelB/DinJ family antitoxin [Pantoea vagans]|uniref:type II toxin-antitoxin system RelB/DinJ family antitoxin n=1 Tax=Pantoea vagans TaxID=470934 RepID=UPI0023AEF456|nr:type II toxin-antitoxin system RelB/DinJ family antitoxin [Pantoea vagans]MDE8559333.1 type II toxin-antitoxin system RelB/DinJ family antitoxin [Pantoea vagans]MDE8579333.1 type II toxin-antitoxin system RelB/DinJ family antitoxin [Pantoea vagans]
MKTINVRIEDQLKAQAEDVLARHGVSPTEAVNHLYLYLVQHGRLPFRVRPVSESPVDVYRSLLRQVRAVSPLIRSVAGLPAGAPERPDMIRHCLHRCRQLQQDIDRNIEFMAGVRCRDTLPRTGDEDTGDYWRWLTIQLRRAVLALEDPAHDLSATLTSAEGQLSSYYWQLATWIDIYDIPASDETGRTV